MTGIAIYMEGGGDRTGTRAQLRRGMETFLRSLKQAARRKALHWKLVPCGSRDAAFSRFRNAVATEPQAVNMLLVDAEGPVANAPREHLRARDGWDLSGAVESRLHLMVQTMETWIVADPDVLRSYYGADFKSAKLPSRANLEDEPKKELQRRLKEATKDTQKRAYHKIKHAKDLLRLIDPDVVRERCPHCERLFRELSQILEAV